MTKTKLKTGDKDNITAIVILLNKEYKEYQESIDKNVPFFDGDRNETKWCLIQFDFNGMIHWWNSDEIDFND
jgi:hypothetical protein